VVNVWNQKVEVNFISVHEIAFGCNVIIVFVLLQEVEQRKMLAC